MSSANERWKYLIYPYINKDLALPKELVANYDTLELFIKNEEGEDVKISSPDIDIHRKRKNNPHMLTRGSIGLRNVINIKQARHSDFMKHITMDNPHNIDKETVYLDNIHNFKPATVLDVDNKRDDVYMTAQQLKYYLEWYQYMIKTRKRIYLYTNPNIATVTIYMGEDNPVQTKDTLVEENIPYKFEAKLSGYFDVHGGFEIKDDTAIYINMVRMAGYQAPNFDMIAINNNIAMVLDSMGRIISWGSNRDNELSETPPGSGYKQLASTKGYNVAIGPSDNLIAWGKNMHMVGATPKDIKFKQVSITEDAGVGIDLNGTLHAWGSNDHIKFGMPNDTFKQVSCGRYHASGIRHDGSVFSWGQNALGQLNDIPEGKEFVQIHCGATHTLARRKNGTIVFWGDTSFNQGSNIPTDAGHICIGGSEYFNMSIRNTGVINTFIPGSALHSRRRHERTYVHLKAYDSCAITISHDGRVVCFGDDGNSDIISKTPTGVYKSW